MNIKKIGMTALAASLVSVSASAGELSVSGSASINAEGYSAPASTGLNGGTTFSMGNAITLSGSGELDNGMTVSLSYELDEGANAAGTATSLFDNHSVTVSSDAMGTLVFVESSSDSILPIFIVTEARNSSVYIVNQRIFFVSRVIKLFISFESFLLVLHF